MVLKRTLLTTLIFLTLFFLGYQSWLVIAPLRYISNEKKYVSLVDQYQILKMQRLVLEEQCALQQTRAKYNKLAAVHLHRHSIPPTRQDLLPNPQIALKATNVTKEQIGLSLQETKTFEQLEAYVSSNKPLASQPLTKNEKSLLEAPSDYFTLQLMGVRDVNELTRFVSENQVEDARIFHTYYLNKDWYVLVCGSYKNHTEALKAIDTLAQPLRNLKPWIRQFSSVQKAIQLYR